MKSPIAGIGSGGVILGHKSMFNGLHQECFNPVMLDILDRFFTQGYYEHMSREQEMFVKSYVRMAGRITNQQMQRMELPHEILQFDRFLGGYKGTKPCQK